ncbi:MAG: monovalent cation/H+ antiporter complex subunit F [Candidatus Nanopelagicales bacterium]
MLIPILSLALVALGVLAAVTRAARGPSGADRAVAAELVFVAAVAAIAILSVVLEAPTLLDVALVTVLIGFLATIGLARLVDRSEEDQ